MFTYPSCSFCSCTKCVPLKGLGVHFTRMRPAFSKALCSSKAPLCAMYNSSSPFCTHTFRPISPPPQGMEPAEVVLCEFHTTLYDGGITWAGNTTGHILYQKKWIKIKTTFLIM